MDMKISATSVRAWAMAAAAVVGIAGLGVLLARDPRTRLTAVVGGVPSRGRAPPVKHKIAL